MGLSQRFLKTEVDLTVESSQQLQVTAALLGRIQIMHIKHVCRVKVLTVLLHSRHHSLNTVLRVFIFITSDHLEIVILDLRVYLQVTTCSSKMVLELLSLLSAVRV
jgi:hypothetical protein